MGDIVSVGPPLFASALSCGIKWRGIRAALIAGSVEAGAPIGPANEIEATGGEGAVDVAYDRGSDFGSRDDAIAQRAGAAPVRERPDARSRAPRCCQPVAPSPPSTAIAVVRAEGPGGPISERAEIEDRASRARVRHCRRKFAVAASSPP